MQKIDKKKQSLKTVEPTHFVKFFSFFLFFACILRLIFCTLWPLVRYENWKEMKISPFNFSIPPYHTKFFFLVLPIWEHQHNKLRRSTKKYVLLLQNLTSDQLTVLDIEINGFMCFFSVKVVWHKIDPYFLSIKPIKCRKTKFYVRQC